MKEYYMKGNGIMSSIKITKSDDLDYLQYNRLLEFEDKLVHAIFLKNHSVGVNLLRDIEIRENTLKIVAKRFNINSSWIVQSNQTHSDNIMEYNENGIEHNILDNYDAYISRRANIASIISFADCVPIFVYDSKQNIYANIHAGWSGVVNGITIKVLDTLVKKYNSNLTNLICCIGPNIHKECFLVNNDLVEIYTNTFSEIVKKYNIIEPTDLCNEKGPQYRIDNNEILKIKMKQFGILNKNIINSNICTVCSSDNFHSRRVEGVNFQKNGGLMMLKKK